MKKKIVSKTKPSRSKRRASGGGKVFAIVAVILLLAFVGYRFFSASGMNKKASRSAERVETGDTAPSVDRVLGRWIRSDTPARLEIRSVNEQGQLHALFFNPDSVQVEMAAAKREQNYLRVYLKLQAPSDPGSTYRLSYDPKLDVLSGEYYDAVARQTNNVTFTRSQ